MNTPRHGQADEGGGGAVLIGCVAVAALALVVFLGGAAYFLMLRSSAPSAVTPIPASAFPVQPSTAAPSSAPSSATSSAASSSSPPEPTGDEGTVISAIDPSVEVGTRSDGENPGIRSGAPEVSGSLDRDVIRRVVRRHIGEVRHCYDLGLESEPELSGRVTVSFVIDGSGTVSHANLADSTFVDSSASGAAVDCILGAVRRWTFPAPEGGVVAVNYPFVLTPG